MRANYKNFRNDLNQIQNINKMYKKYKNPRKYADNKLLSFCPVNIRFHRNFLTFLISLLTFLISKNLETQFQIKSCLMDFCQNWILNMNLSLRFEIFTFFETFRNKRTHSTTLCFISNNMKGRLTKRIIKVRLHFKKNF